MAEMRLLQGNEACALGALAAGCRFFAGYPITPSSEIAELMARRLPSLGGLFVQMEDEIASLAACIGAALGGMKVLTATSGPGFSLMQEHIGFAAIAEIPCVIVEVMRGGPSTGLPTLPSQGDLMQARWGTHGDHPMIALAPASVREVFDQTVRAFDLSERFRTPVIVLYDEVLAHLRERVELPASVPVPDRLRPAASDYRPYAGEEDRVAPLAAFGDGARFHVTGLVHDARGYPTSDPQEAGAMQRRLQRKVDGHLDDLAAWEAWQMEDAEVAVVAVGIVARAAREAVAAARERGVRAGLLRPITLWPFPVDVVYEAASRLRTLVVAEMNLGQMRLEVERAAGGRTAVVGCHRADGECIAPEEIVDHLLAAVPVGR